MFKKIATITVTAALAVTVSLSVTATAAAKPDDCARVAKADRALCQQVKRQLPYAYATPDAGLNQIAGGKTLVRKITHQGLSKTAMHHRLHTQAVKYARYATSGTIIVNTATMRKYFGPDAHYEVYTQGDHVAVSIVEP